MCNWQYFLNKFYELYLQAVNAKCLFQKISQYKRFAWKCILLHSKNIQFSLMTEL